MSKNKYPYSQGTAIKLYNLDAKGVCWELCRHWIAGHLRGTWEISSSIWDVDTGRSGFSKVLESHKKRRNFSEENKALDDLDYTNSAVRRFNTFGKKTGLRTRLDVIDHVLTVPGVYLYAFTDTGTGGHAMAFDSSENDTLTFFDPNQGEWEFHNESHGAMRSWWSDFWEARGDGDIDYKRHFTNGVRELVRYTTG